MQNQLKQFGYYLKVREVGFATLLTILHSERFTAVIEQRGF